MSELLATPSQTAGPFLHIGLRPHAMDHDGSVRLAVVVTDGDGQPVNDALLECWNAVGFARQPTDHAGCCEVALPAPEAAQPYVNVCVFARGLLRQLHTRIYLCDAAAYGADELLQHVPEARRATLFARRDANAAGFWRFDMRLQGLDETVFFDV